MASSSKNKGARKNDSQETTEEDKTELCPGFKDVDAFVKVSKTKAEEDIVRSQLAAAVQGQRGLSFCCDHELKFRGALKFEKTPVRYC